MPYQQLLLLLYLFVREVHKPTEKQKSITVKQTNSANRKVQTIFAVITDIDSDCKVSIRQPKIIVK